jgi:hypothetical protein
MGDAAACNEWWTETMLRLAGEGVDGSTPDFILRLEDDVIVNEHILHNVSTWPALDKPDFGMGLLFNWDGQWPPLPQSQRWHFDGSLRRLDLDLAGAQAQVFRASFVPKMISQISNAQRWHPPGELVYEKASRATRLAGKYVYLHRPSLVNCHVGCVMSADGCKHGGHFSRKTWHPTWRRGRDPEPRRL